MGLTQQSDSVHFYLSSFLCLKWPVVIGAPAALWDQKVTFRMEASSEKEGEKA